MAVDEPAPTPDGAPLEVRAEPPTQVAVGETPVQPDLDDVDCCIRHYVQWVNGRPQTGRCSEAVGPEQQAEAARADERARLDADHAFPGPEIAAADGYIVFVGGATDAAAEKPLDLDVLRVRYLRGHDHWDPRIVRRDVKALVDALDRARGVRGIYKEQLEHMTGERDRLRAETTGGYWRTEYTCGQIVDWRTNVPPCADRHDLYTRRVWTGDRVRVPVEPAEDLAIAEQMLPAGSEALPVWEPVTGEGGPR